MYTLNRVNMDITSKSEDLFPWWSFTHSKHDDTQQQYINSIYAVYIHITLTCDANVGGNRWFFIKFHNWPGLNMNSRYQLDINQFSVAIPILYMIWSVFWKVIVFCGWNWLQVHLYTAIYGNSCQSVGLVDAYTPCIQLYVGNYCQSVVCRCMYTCIQLYVEIIVSLSDW